MELIFKEILLFAWISLMIYIPSIRNPSPDRSYRGAVVEYSPLGNVSIQTPAEVLRLNLNQYEKLIAEAALIEADIIVFPEYGLTTLSISSLSRLDARPFLQQFPNIDETASQSFCDESNDSHREDHLVFIKLSCYSRQYQIYVVANVGEIVACHPGQNTTANQVCPEDGAFQYNTNVVFDRNGRFIARYRKTHLFLEPLFQTPAVADLTVFSTDFGVNFGLLTCFDIMYYTPGLSLFYEQEIKDFIYPTAWIDELPFLTAIQTQEGWSRSLGINLLASNYHRPDNGQIGSGIYNATGALNYTSDPDSGTRLLIADLRSSTSEVSAPQSSKEDGYSNNLNFTKNVNEVNHSMWYEDISNYSTIELEHGVSKNTMLCHNDLCCQLIYSITCPQSEVNCDTYRLLSYSGLRSLGGGAYTIYTQVCGLVACADQSVQSCAKPSTNQNARFHMLQLVGNFSSAQQVFPTGITKDYQLLPYGSFEHFIYPNGSHKLTVVNPLTNALALELYGRTYERDNTR